jgi:serine/threonine-protein kinase
MSSTMRLLGKYEVQAAIGKGPRSKVYRATDLDSQHAVAIKVFRSDAILPAALDAFRPVAEALTRLRHPGVAGLVELLERDGKIMLVWELAEGKSLASLLLDGGRPEPKASWHIARQILEALAHAHTQGLVHRDLKPENVILGAGGHVKLTDFGISSLYAAPSERVQYFSPEHFAFGKLTARSDIYQAATLIYQMVTGQLPFSGSAAEIEKRVAQERPVDPSSLNHHLAWQLDFVVQKALAKRPEERYASAFDFAEGLRLGLQDTIGRPLEPAHTDLTFTEPAAAQPAPVEKAAATPAPTAPAAEVPEPPKAPAPAPATPAAKAPEPPKSPLLQNAGLLTPKHAPAAPAKPAAPPAPAAAAPAPATASEKPGVLFVDDDERILAALRVVFRQEYDVQTAADGEAALEILRRGGIQVIVSDQRMPGMTGVELLRKARTVAPNAIRVLLTGYTDLASLVGSINQGEITRFVMKPWDNDELRQSIAEAVQAAAQLAAAPPPAKPEAPRSAGSLLVIDRGEGMARGLERLLAGSAQVLHVASAAEAVKVMAKEEIAAVVADAETGVGALVVLFRELKAKRPGVRSIMLTEEPDSDVAIELINNAHIFRLLPKPVSAKDLRTQVAEALRRYAAYKQALARTSQAAA